MARGTPPQGTKLSEVTVRQFVSVVALVVLIVVALWMVMGVLRAAQHRQQVVE